MQVTEAVELSKDDRSNFSDLLVWLFERGWFNHAGFLLINCVRVRTHVSVWSVGAAGPADWVAPVECLTFR